MADQYLHSVRILRDVCHGCTNCLKSCPTEAIRVRNGKAMILPSRCIDCGTCIRRCTYHAATAGSDSLEGLKNYQYNIVLAAPSLYAQFPEKVSAGVIWQSLHDLGFDEIFDVGLASEYIAMEIADYVKNYTGKRKPLISATCPAVLRLIQVKFPELIKQIVPILPPAEAAAIYVKSKAAREHKLAKADIGVWFIAPCPSKGANIRQPVDVIHPEIDGYFSVKEIYTRIMKNMSNLGSGKRNVTTGSSYGMCWGSAGGEIISAGLVNAISVNGIEEAYEALEQISMNKMPTLDYLECNACQGGCIGGPMVAENKFVAESNLKRRIAVMREHEPADREETMLASMVCKGFPLSQDYTIPIKPRPMMQLDDDIIEAMKKFEQMEDVLQSLPGLDCGACGAPSCQCLAEDIVQGRAHDMDCIYKLRGQVRKLAYGMIELSKQIPLTSGPEENLSGPDEKEVLPGAGK
jgi:iron only hydrogenase large subunit-like protein